MNAWSTAEYAAVYRAEAEDPARGEALWLGNSQLHTVNQARPGDSVAPEYAGEALGRRVYGLSLNNTNCQEQLVVLHWALRRRDVDWLILPVCYDDLREDGVRAELAELVTPQVTAALATRPEGRRLADELAATEDVAADVQGTSPSHRSWQDHSEAQLEALLQKHWGLWAERGDLLATVKFKLYQLRNVTFGIAATSKRRMIPLRTKKNMAALAELLEVARQHDVRTLVYTVPLRWDVEPPYDLDTYRRWKQELAELTAECGATRFADLDRLVPDELWGRHHGREVDFMHFQGDGHRLLGERVAALIGDDPVAPQTALGR